MTCSMVLVVRTNVIVVVELRTVTKPMELVLVGPVRKAGKGKHVSKVGNVNMVVNVNKAAGVDKVSYVNKVSNVRLTAQSETVKQLEG